MKAALRSETQLQRSETKAVGRADRPALTTLSRPFLPRFPPFFRRSFALSGFLAPRRRKWAKNGVKWAKNGQDRRLVSSALAALPTAPAQTLERNIRQWKAVQLEGALGPVWRSTTHGLMDREMVTLSRFDRLRTILLKKHHCCRNCQAALRWAQDVRVQRRGRADG